MQKDSVLGLGVFLEGGWRGGGMGPNFFIRFYESRAQPGPDGLGTSCSGMCLT